MEGKGEEKRYLQETGDNRRNSESWSCRRSQRTAEELLEKAEGSEERAERSEEVSENNSDMSEVWSE
jgi:hypothetical protein